MSLNFSNNAFYYLKRCEKPSVIFFARRCQEDLKRERERIAEELTDICGFKMIPRKEVTQYAYRKGKKIKINGKGYHLKKST